jgi:hypothetical protein
LLSNRRLALRNRSDVMTRARTSSRTLAAVAALALATTSCRGATALHFVVCLDFDPAALPLRTVRVKINNASGVSLTGSAGQEVTITDASQFPMRFSVFASGNQSEALTVSVEALTNMRPMGMGATPADITARISTSFVAGEVRTVPVLLERSSRGHHVCARSNVPRRSLRDSGDHERCVHERRDLRSQRRRRRGRHERRGELPCGLDRGPSARRGHHARDAPRDRTARQRPRGLASGGGDRDEHGQRQRDRR